MGQTIEATFTPTKPETIMNLVGINDANLRLIEESYDVQVTDTGSEIEVTGEESIVKKIMQIFTALDKVVTRGVTITATILHVSPYTIKSSMSHIMCYVISF